MDLRERSLDRWAAAVLAGWGPRLAATVVLVRPKVARWRPVPDLAAVGNAFAADHHTLEETLDCLRLLGDVTNRTVRRRLRGHSSLVAVTTGWADAALERDRAASTLAPIDVLRLRLRQHFQIAGGLRTDPALHAVLLVIDPGTPMAADHLEVIAAHTHHVFARGETVAGGVNGVIVVLVPRSTTLGTDTARLVERLHAEPGLDSRGLRVWVEPLGRSIDFIDAHLLDLAR